MTMTTEQAAEYTAESLARARRNMEAAHAALESGNVSIEQLQLLADEAKPSRPSYRLWKEFDQYMTQVLGCTYEPSRVVRDRERRCYTKDDRIIFLFKG